MVERIANGQGRLQDIDLLNSVSDNIQGRTICALGDAAAMPVLSFVKKFGNEFEYFAANRRSLNGDRLEA